MLPAGPALCGTHGIWKAIGNREIFNIINDIDILGIAESWMNKDDNRYLKGVLNYSKHRKR